MSTYVMAACWPIQIPPTPKAVLISLADNANDHGYCWPSIATISARTCFGKTAVIEAIRWLEEHGLVVADRENGRHTRYQIKPNGMTPELFDAAGNPSASRTGTADEPVREANRSARQTGPGGGPDLSASRSIPVRQADTNRQEPTKNRQSLAQRSASRFGEFWEAYPKRVGKKPSAARWAAKGLDARADEIIADVRRRVAEDGRWIEGFAPDPLTYLNQERWQDDIQPRRQPASTQPASLAQHAAPAAPRDPLAVPESQLEYQISYIRQQHAYGAYGDGPEADAERDRLIAEARRKHAPAEAEPA